jgi:hypothetical protein
VWLASASSNAPSCLSSSTDCALQQFGAWCSCHGSYPALCPDSTKVWDVLKMLFTASHGSAAPTGPWRGPHRRAGRGGDLLRLLVTCKINAWHMWDLDPTQVTGYYAYQIGLRLPRARRRGASGGGRRRGASRAHPAGHCPAQLGAAGRCSK